VLANIRMLMYFMQAFSRKICYPVCCRCSSTRYSRIKSSVM